MKKLLSLILVLLLLLSSAACGTRQAPSTTVAADGTAKTVLRLGGLKGATSMGMVKLLSDAEAGTTAVNYEFTMAAAADELTPKLLKGELDAVAVPANLASVLYNKSNGAVEVAAVTTLGLLYIVEKGGEEIGSAADLKGKTLYATGKGTTPEYALRYLLSQNGLDMDKDLTVEWKSEPTEVVSQMATQDHAVAMLPQPFATVAQTQLENLRIAVDMNEGWAQTGKQLVTAVLAVRKAYAEANPDAVKMLLQEFAASVDYINANPAEGGTLIEKYGITKAAVAQKAIPYCNMVCITGTEMQTALTGYLQVLFDLNSAAVGGKLPGEDFYKA